MRLISVGREIAPAVVVDVLERDIGATPPLCMPACADSWMRPNEPSAEVDFGAVIVEAILHIEADRAAERVQSEHRIAAHDGHVVDGDRRAGSRD